MREPMPESSASRSQETPGEGTPAVRLQRAEQAIADLQIRISFMERSMREQDDVLREFADRVCRLEAALAKWVESLESPPADASLSARAEVEGKL